MIQKTSNLQTNLFIHKNCTKAAGKRLESGRTRGATLRGIDLSLLVALLISGCTAAYSPAPLPINHPANPAAPEAPPPLSSQALRGESIPPVSTEEAPVQDPHASHSMGHGGH
ncbi:MAG: hypothetical protein HY267_03705 [Deltaproteobacteria bacterium]|nr:hypothetical protein [Deltaproteobacteria bacterium]